MSTRIVRGRKFSIALAARPRPDPIKLQIKTEYLTDEEAQALAFYLTKAAARAKFKLTPTRKK